jgi:type IV secretory pathway VirD2 relaxase
MKTGDRTSSSAPVPSLLLRPRIGGRGGQGHAQRVPTFRQFVLARAQQRFNRLAGSGRPGSRNRVGARGVTADVGRPGPGSRRCVMKARVVQMRTCGIAAARVHLDYIERDGVERDGSAGRLYSDVPGEVRQSLANSLPGERHQFRFIISPEDAQNLDLTAFTCELMAQVERDTGRRLIWGAVNHHDTDNPHVHVVLRGVDGAGREVWLERAYISERIRWQAQHLVTRELGLRTSLEMSHQLTREISQERFTTVDRKLAHLLSPSKAIDIRRLALTTDGPSRSRAMARLAVLEQFGLAERTSPSAWQLKANWEDALRALGKRGDIIHRIHSALHGQGDPSRYAVIDGSVEHPPIEGVLRRKGLHDELRGDVYAVVETAQGRAHYVRVSPTVAEGLREGAVVRLEVSPERVARKIDHAIQLVASQANGTYDAAAHLRQLETTPSRAPGGAPFDPKALVAQAVRRLERLERDQIVSRRPDGTWRVPTELVKILAERERSSPRFQTKIEVLAGSASRDVRHVGPTWLDAQHGKDETRAAYGFGAELSATLRERAAFLEQLGIAGTPAERHRELRRREELALGTKLASAIGGMFVADPPPDFRGRLLACETTAPGSAYVRVVDEATRRLVLVPAAAFHKALEGQVVALTRDPNGRLVARRTGLSRGE